MEVVEGDAESASVALAPLLASAPAETHHLNVELMMARSPEEARAWWTPSGAPAAVVVLRSGVAHPHGDVSAMADLAHRSTAVTTPERCAGEIRATTRFASEIACASSAEIGVLRTEQLMQHLEDVPVHPPSGGARLAVMDEADALAQWMNAFDKDTGSQPDPAFNRMLVEHYIDTQKLFVWETDGRPVATTARFANVGGVEELKFVYTPPSDRGHGYGAAVVAHAADAICAEGQACVLRADLSKPGPQRLYRKVGFKPIAEHISLQMT